METMVKGSIKRSRARVLEEVARNGEGSAQKKLLISDQVFQQDEKKEIPQLAISFRGSPEDSRKVEDDISSEQLVEEELKDLYV